MKWNQRFYESTRGRIVTLLRRAGRTVNELAEALELTDNAVRSHLLSLERDGLVQQRGTRRGSRKPHLAYELTPGAEQLFSKAYEPVLLLLIEVLSERYSPKDVESILREIGHRTAAPYLESLRELSFMDRLKKALEIVGEIGGLAELENREGRWSIQGFGCPLASTVSACPGACRLLETLLTDLVGVPVREECRKGSSPSCRFEVALEGVA